FVDATSGAFTWTPAIAPATNLIGLVVTDSPGGLSATQTFTAIVVPPPQLSAPGFQAGHFVLSWPTVSGQAYQVEFNTNLLISIWTPLDAPLTGTGAPLSFTNAAVSAAQ